MKMPNDEYGKWDEEMSRHNAIRRARERGMSYGEAEDYVDARAREIDGLMDEIETDETDKP